MNVVSITTRVQPPGGLSAAETKLFREIVASCRADHFVPSDVPLLVSYVQATAASHRCAKALTKNPKLVMVWERATRLQATLATRLRLAPQSRMDAKTAARRTRMPLPSAYDTMAGDA